MRKPLAATAFSLVEVTLALGIAAFCLIAVFGIMPVGVQTNRNATSQTPRLNIMAAVVADLRATLKTPGHDRHIVAICIPFGHLDHVIFRQRRSMLQRSCGLDQSLWRCLGSSYPASLPSECNLPFGGKFNVCRFEG